MCQQARAGTALQPVEWVRIEDFIKFGSPVQQLRDSAQTQQQGALEDPAAKVKLPLLLFKCKLPPVYDQHGVKIYLSFYLLFTWASWSFVVFVRRIACLS